nr:hypothetical protein CR513_32708 [Ipomoea batatas]
MAIPAERPARPQARPEESTDDHSDNQAVNTQHTSHNHRHNGLHHQLRPHDAHRRHTNPTLRGPICTSRERIDVQENTRAAAAPRKPKNGAVSSPLKADDIFSGAFESGFDRICSDGVIDRI